MALSKEDSKYFEEAFNMMASQGWKDLMDNMKLERDSVAETILKNPLTEPEYNYSKGVLSTMDMFLGLKDRTENVYEQAKADQED